MVKIQRFVCNPVQENTYLIWDDETLQAAIVDCGAYTTIEQRRIQEFIDSHQLQLCYLLQTHAHFDHIFGLPYFAAQYALKPLMHASDIPFYKNMPSMAQMMGLDIQGDLPAVEKTLRHNQIIKLGNAIIQVLHTPGHTPGGVCFWVAQDNLLFSGDTLFQSSLGRTDLPGGDMEQELSSILNVLFTLPKETTVYPGHGPETTIGYEMTNNPYF